MVSEDTVEEHMCLGRYQGGCRQQHIHLPKLADYGRYLLTVPFFPHLGVEGSVVNSHGGENNSYLYEGHLSS